MYKAKTKIGDYEVGDVVPDELAEVWSGMYKESPVEQCDSSGEPKQDEDLKEPEEMLPEETNDLAWVDDYMARNAGVVIKNLEKDHFSKNILNALLKHELANKDRSTVIDALDNGLQGD